MVQFVDVDAMRRWISHEGVEPLLEDLVAYLEDDYRRWEQFDNTKWKRWRPFMPGTSGWSLS